MKEKGKHTAYQEYRGERGNTRGLIANSVDRYFAEKARKEGKKIPEGLSVLKFAELWILSTLAAHGPLWGRGIIEHVRRATEIAENGEILFPGYSIAQGHVFGLLRDYEAKGYLEAADAATLPPQERFLPRNTRLYRLTPAGLDYYTKLKEQYKGAVTGSLRTLQMLMSQVYDIDVMTAPIKRAYTDRKGDPEKLM